MNSRGKDYPVERGLIYQAPLVRALLRESDPKTQTRRTRGLEKLNAAPDQWRIGTPEEWMAPTTMRPRLGGHPEQGRGWFMFRNLQDGGMIALRCPYGVPGDRLWVRETWRYADWTEDGDPWIEYKADSARVLREPRGEWAERVGDVWAELSDPANYQLDNRAADRRWRPAIHIPRFASRILLELTDVRVQRLQDISEEDCIAEGIVRWDCPGGTYPFAVNAEGDLNAATARLAYHGLWNQINGRGAWDANPWVWALAFKRLEPPHA